MKNFDHNIGFWEKRNFFRRKLSKIAKNCDHNIDPWKQAGSHVQGDQIGWIFAKWAIVYFRQLFNIAELAQILDYIIYITVKVAH
jgi:hypothetical protein